MTTNIENVPKAGHAHDIAPTKVLSIHGETRKLTYDHHERAHADDGSVASGHLDVELGVDGDELTLDVMVNGIGFADPQANTAGRMDIERTEHLIRSLIACVKEAKKNAIDKPALFGSEYGN